MLNSKTLRCLLITKLGPVIPSNHNLQSDNLGYIKHQTYTSTGYLLNTVI